MILYIYVFFIHIYSDVIGKSWARLFLRKRARVRGAQKINNMICKLCLEEKELINSHIIPEFLYNYKTLYDHKNRITEYNEDREKQAKFIQKGFRDSNILCADCDGKIIGDKYEKYSKENFYDKLYCLINKNEKEYKMIIDYSKIKIFFLSMIWRMSISKLEQFSEVDLGYLHNKKIRDMIFSDNPGNKNDYPTIVISGRHEDDDNLSPSSFLVYPRRFRDEHGVCYFFSISGFYHIFYISNHNLPEYVNYCSVNENGEIIVLQATDNDRKNWINKILKVRMFK